MYKLASTPTQTPRHPAQRVAKIARESSPQKRAAARKEKKTAGAITTSRARDKFTSLPGEGRKSPRDKFAYRKIIIPGPAAAHVNNRAGAAQAGIGDRSPRGRARRMLMALSTPPPSFLSPPRQSLPSPPVYLDPFASAARSRPCLARN